MKKWLVAIVCVLALCLAVCCCAAAETSTVKPPNEEKVEFNTRVVEKGGDATITTDVSTGSGYQAIKLVVKDTTDWTLATEEIKNVSAASNGKLSFTINTSTLTEGHIYFAELVALPTESSAASTWKSYWNSLLTVVPSGTTGPHIYTNKTQIGTGVYVLYVTAYDPAATNVWILMDGEARQSRPGNNMSWVDGYDLPGSYTVGATFMYADGTQKNATEVTITAVTESDPALYASNVTPVTFKLGNASEKSMAEFPETVTAGTDIVYSIKPVTKDLGLDDAGEIQQVWYDSWLDDRTEEDNSTDLPSYRQRVEPHTAEEKLIGNGQTITISKDDLQVGHTYQLHVAISSTGRTPVIYEKIFVVQPATMNNREITLQVKGQENQNSVSLPVYEDFKLIATAPQTIIENAEEQPMTLVRFWADDHYEYLNNWIGGDWTGSFEFDWKTWWAAEHKYFIQVYDGEIGDTPWDELPWDAARTSSILTITATKDSSITAAKPEYSFSPANNVVTQGDYYTVTVTNAATLNENVYIGAELYNGNDIDSYYECHEGRIMVPTADLLPGFYTLGIYAETPGAGYKMGTPHCFQVVAPQTPPANGFMITTTVPLENGKRNVESFERFGVTFFAPDKDGYIRYYRFFDGQNWWWDNWFERSVTLETELEPGTWEIRAEVVYEPKSGNGEEIRYLSEPIAITATAPHGESTIMLDAAGSYTKGSTGYTVSIKDFQTDKLINTETYGDSYWEVTLEEANGRRLKRYCRDDGDALQQTFTFNDGLFRAGETYKAWLHMNIQGYNSIHDEVVFTVVNSATVNTTMLQLKVDNSASADVREFDTHDDFNVKVTKSDDITAVRVLNGDNWDYWWGDDSYERDWSFGYGIYGLVAQGTTQTPRWEKDGFDWGSFDWDRDVTWSVTSNTVTVRVNASKGHIGVPTLTLNKAQYTRGEKITVTVGKVEGATWYDLKILPINEYGDEDWGRKTEQHLEADGSGEGTVTFTARTDHMEPGMYRVWVDDNGPGYIGNSTRRIEIEIKAGSQAPKAVLDVPATVSTCTRAMVYGYVPDADWIWVEIRKEGEPGWRNEFNDSQGQNAWTWEFSDPFKGTYLFTLYGHKNGEDVKVAGPVSMQIKATKGDLNGVSITANTNMITIGQNGASSGVSGSFTKDSHAEWYEMQLVYRGPNGDWGDRHIKSRHYVASDTASFTFDSTDFNQGTGVYEIHITGGAAGYNGSDSRYRILALERATHAPIVLEVRKDDGTTGSDLSLLANENVTVRICAPGATAIRFFDGERWDWWDNRMLDNNGWAEFGRSKNAGEYVFIAQASYDKDKNGNDYDWEHFNDWENFDTNRDLHWTATSNMVYATVTASGYTAEPVIANIGQVTRGQLMPVTVTSAGTAGTATFATSLDAFIQREDGWNVMNGIGIGNLESNDYPYTFQFPSGGMEPGTYIVTVYSHALGYNSSRATATFEVVEQANDPFILEIQDGLIAGENFSISAYAKGASWIDLYFQGDWDGQPHDWGHFDGEGIQITQSNLNGGSYEFWGIAHYTDDQDHETGTKISETVFREVQWRGSLEDPVIHASTTYSVSKGGTFTVDNLDQDCHWWIEMNEQEPDENGEMVWVKVARWDSDGGIPENGFPISTQELTVGHRYRIDVGVNRYGFEPGNDWAEFMAVGEASNRVTMTIDQDSQYSPDHWPSSRNIHWTVHAPGSTAIRVWEDGNWNWMDSRNMDNNGDYHGTTNLHDPGKRTLFAQACYDDNINWNTVNWNNFDWNGLGWADMSATITVTVYANGQVSAPTYSGPVAVKSGEDIVVTITNPIQGQWYNAQLRELNGRIIWTDFDWDDQNRYVIPTNDVEPGVYQLVVWTDTEGKLGCEAKQSIVIDNLSGAHVFKLPAGLTTVEAEAFAGVPMDVVIVQGNNQPLNLRFLNRTETKYVVANEEDVTIPQNHTFEVITLAQYNILK